MVNVKTIQAPEAITHNALLAIICTLITELPLSVHLFGRKAQGIDNAPNNLKRK